MYERILYSVRGQRTPLRGSAAISKTKRKMRRRGEDRIAVFRCVTQPKACVCPGGCISATGSAGGKG